jgi:saccharopine dehydrogenase (NAD+, L-lysine forming)
MKSLLIRAEDKNIWESRAPLIPDQVKEILGETGATAYVEKSEKRYFKDSAYEDCGAVLCDSMHPGDVIVGVKEIPEDKIIDNKTYLFFSHTIKGQKSGMPLLRKIMAGGSTLIDYEKIVDDENRRLIYFGRYAGDAGAIDILSLMGEFWDYHGIKTPFSQCRRAHEYDSVEDAKRHIRKIGDTIREEGLPEQLCPMVIGVMGYGNVSMGAQQIFDCLPTQGVPPHELISFAKGGGGGDTRNVHVTVFKEKDLVRHIDGKSFDLQEYYNHPERFVSRFEDYLPHMNILVNAVYWEKRYPRFVTWDGLKKAAEGFSQPKLQGIADISCDTNGSVECNVRSTDSGMPAYLCDPVRRTTTDGHRGDGIVLLAVDNLPCELPNDASTFFGDQLKKVVPNILEADYEGTLETSGLSPEVQNAVIVYRGVLTANYQYLKAHL